MKEKKLCLKFFKNDAVWVAENLIGKILCRKINGQIIRDKIVEAEAYLGESDSASHARFGKTNRSQTMWEDGGTVYVYLCYGMHHMLNFVTGEKGCPQAVLIRATENANGPGKVCKYFGIDRSLNGTLIGRELWIEEGAPCTVEMLPRIGIGYAQENDRQALLRFALKK